MSEENKAPEETVKPEESAKTETQQEAPKAEAKPEAPKADAAPKAPKAEATPEAKPAAPKPAAAAKPAAEKAPEPEKEPDPRLIEAQQRLETLKGKIAAKFGDAAIEEADVKKFTPTLVIKPEYWVDTVEYVKTDPSLLFFYPEAMAGTDYKDKGYIEVFTLLHSFELDYDIALKVRGPRDNGSVPSITPIFSGFNWEEREIYDLLGLRFEGHPDLRRIMLEEEWQGHPLRKDYVVMD